MNVATRLEAAAAVLALHDLNIAARQEADDAALDYEVYKVLTLHKVSLTERLKAADAEIAEINGKIALLDELIAAESAEKPQCEYQI
jgi:PDZ domain-containing secreted protein